MSIIDEVECLRRIPLFANIEVPKLKLLAFTSERICFPAGDVLFRQNEMGNTAYIILDGEAHVLVDTPGGPLDVATLRRSDIVGEIAILCDVPRTASVIAETDLTVLCVSKDTFFRMVMEFPQIGIEIMRVLAQRLEHTTRQVRQMATAVAAPASAPA